METILIIFRLQNTVDHTLRVLDSCVQLFRTTALFQSCQTIGSNLSMLVDVSHRAHQWTKNDFRVILKEVDLNQQGE